MKTYKDFYYRLGCYDMVESKEKIWCSSNKQNSLCEIDKKTKKIEILEQFQREPLYKDKLYRAINKIGNKLVLTPFFASSITIYDISKREAEYIEILDAESKNVDNKNEKGKFRTSIVNGRFVYMLGLHYPAILKLDSDTKQVNYLTNWVEKLGDIKVDYRGYINDGIVIGNVAYMPIGCAPKILCLDLLTDTISIRHIKTSLSGFSGISFDGQEYWLTGRGKNSNIVIKWNPLTDQVTEINVLLDSEKEILNPFYSPLIIEKDVYLFPMRARHVYKINRVTSEVMVCEELNGLFDKGDGLFCPYYGLPPKMASDTIRFITGSDFIWHEYDYVNNCLESYEIRFDERTDIIERKLSLRFQRNLGKDAEKKTVKEGFKFPFLKYIDFLCKVDSVQKSNMDTGYKCSIGNMIYETVYR